MNLPDPTKIVMTIGVQSLQGVGFQSPADDYIFGMALGNAIKEQYYKELDECLDGGNDKRFFVLFFRGTKLFAAENEVGGLTVMLPDEY